MYGEHPNLADRYRNVIGIVMNQIMRGQLLTVFGCGMRARASKPFGDVELTRNMATGWIVPAGVS